MDTRGYIGIDFGTANSHFAYCEQDARDAKPIPLLGAGGKPSVPSYLLWEINAELRRLPKTWGQLAIDEWMLGDDDDGGQNDRYMLTGAFKPDLVTSPMSRDAAREFLAYARQDMLQNRIPPRLHEQPGWQVIIGVPAEIGDAHRGYTEAAAREAGFEQVQCLEEPLGAVGYHLGKGQITDRDLDAGVLVVDFGGGTLDLSTVDRGGVKEPWGDPKLGGRLFDDLFYQWVVDSNRVNLSEFSKTKLLGIWWLHCRGLKENFSRHWNRKQTDDFNDFKGRIETCDGGNFGALRGVGVGEFLERARQYRPSDLARGYFRSINSPLQSLGESEPVDLLDWIREVLSRGPARRYGTIILTGGSSSWPFIVPMVREVFGDAEILIPNNPECTIGEGLALWHVLNRRYRSQQKTALADVPALQKMLDKVVAAATRRAGADISQEIAGHIMAVARPRFLQWWQQGGRLADVEREVAAACRQIPSKALIDARLARLLPEVAGDASEAMRDWLVQQDVKLGDWTGLPLSGGVGVQNLSLTVSIADDLADAAVRDAVIKVTAAILGALFAVIMLTSVTLAATPLAFLLVPAGIAGVWMGKDWIKEKVVTTDFSGDKLKTLQGLYGINKLDEALTKGDEDCRKAVADVIEVAMKGVRVQLEALIASARDEVLRRYGLLDKLSRLQMPPTDTVQDGLTAYQDGDFDLALRSLQPRAEGGDAEAQCNLGVICEEGRGVVQDDRKAVSWYRKAADQGDADAQTFLGKMYRSGCGVAKDDREAASWFRKAAEQGNAPAQWCLGMMYAEGSGVARDDHQAVRWWREAAEAGYANAQYNLGKMHRSGRGVAKNAGKAAGWFRRAAEQGHPEAQQALDMLVGR